MMKNEGIEERFYIPLEFYNEWNALLVQSRFAHLRMGSRGVPLGTPLASEHLHAKACYIADKLGLKSRNLLELHYQDK